MCEKNETRGGGGRRGSLKRRIEIRFIDFRSHSPFFSRRSRGREGREGGGHEGSDGSTERGSGEKKQERKEHYRR